MKVLIILVLTMALSGCYWLLPSRPGPTVEPNRRDGSGVSLHGYFCGPGYPGVTDESREARIRQLEAIKPLDDVDAACKAHDICYERHGYTDKSCDKALDGMLSGLRLSSSRCKALVLNIRLFFGLVTGAIPGVGHDRKLGDAVVDLMTLPFRIWAEGQFWVMTTLMGANRPADRYEICNGDKPR